MYSSSVIFLFEQFQEKAFLTSEKLSKVSSICKIFQDTSSFEQFKFLYDWDVKKCFKVGIDRSLMLIVLLRKMKESHDMCLQYLQCQEVKQC